MFRFFWLLFGMLVRVFRGRQSLLLENLALRQQLVALKRRHPRPSLGLFDKLFWVSARQVWSAWKESLLIVTPETVVRWHRSGFRMYWRLISRVRRQVGRKQTPKEVRELISRIVAENPTWLRPGEAVGIDCRKGGIDQTVRPIGRSLRGWSGEATDRSKPSDNVPTLARVAPEPRGDGVSASMRRRGARLGGKAAN